MHIRTMNESDLDLAAAWTKSEGWAGETRTVFESFHRYHPSGCFIAERDGRRIGICVAVPYRSSGFVGELVVLRNVRGGFVGPRIFEHSIDHLREKGIPDIYLDGVEKAVPYYESVGFRKICRSMRFVGKIAGIAYPDIRPMAEADLSAVFRLDRTAFGEDRSFFLREKWSRFPDYCRVAEENGIITGFIMAQPGIGVIVAGPWIVDDPMGHPERLLRSLALETGDTPLRLGVLDTNESAVRLVAGLPEMKRIFSCWRMVLGESDRLGNSPMCYAIGSPAKG